ncbi:MAG: TrbC/VirB2 family protein [Woeseiaceae bacterium]|nr:TrbC/VirB2 family protein [Woeseiaceae bacterium]
MNNNPQWLNDVLRTGDKIIAEGKARDSALAQEAMLNDTRPLRQQIVEGLQGLVALAVAIVGLFVGGSAFGWIGALVLGVVGFFGAVFVFHFVGEKFSDMAEKRLWKNRPQDRTRDDLLQYWEAKFGVPIRKELVDEIDQNGRAWVMDDKANFILRMHTGERVFVGNKDASGLDVTPRGGRKLDMRTAYLMMLIRASAGSDSCKLNGRKKDLALMWAAARLFDIDVKDYEPDAFALEVHQNMKRQYQEARP